MLKLASFNIHGGDLHSQLQHNPQDILSLTFNPGKKTTRGVADDQTGSQADKDSFTVLQGRCFHSVLFNGGE